MNNCRPFPAPRNAPLSDQNGDSTGYWLALSHSPCRLNRPYVAVLFDALEEGILGGSSPQLDTTRVLDVVSITREASVADRLASPATDHRSSFR